MHGDNNEYYEKQDIVKNIYFKAIFTSTKNNFFHQHMIDFLNRLEFSDQKYQTNETVRYKNYKDRFLFPIKDFVSFGTDLQSTCFDVNQILKM